jgi:hypothetical protein
MLKLLFFIINFSFSVFANNTFKFILKNERTLTDPVYILKNELFNVQYVTNEKKPYNFILSDSKDKIIYTRKEKKSPYYLYGDNSSGIKYDSISSIDEYEITIKDNKNSIKFNIVSNIPSTTTLTTLFPNSTTTSTKLRTSSTSKTSPSPSKTSPSTSTSKTSTSPSKTSPSPSTLPSTSNSKTSPSTSPSTSTTSKPSGIDISYCNKGFPVIFDSSKDHISLHYDMSYDPDDYLSAVADRSVIEPTYGTIFLRNQTSRVIGTCGGSCSGYNKPADKLMQYTYGDVGGYKLTIGANDPKLYTEAMNYEFNLFKSTIQRAGRIFVKEGGESDFTKRVIEQLEKWLANSGKCVYIVQHSSTNEKNNGPGVLSYVKSKANYIKISDGNPPYRKSNWSLNGKTFDFYGLRSRWKCAWQLSFDDFKLAKSYCNGKGKVEPIQKCVDFSDTHELLYIIGVGNLGINGFVNTYLVEVPEDEKIKCDAI